jgi:formylmethanofuran dehydrogenase subunit E
LFIKDLKIKEMEDLRMKKNEQVTREIFNSVLNRLSAEFSNVDEQKLRLVITTKSEIFREVLCYKETKCFLMSEVGLKELKSDLENQIYNEVKGEFLEDDEDFGKCENCGEELSYMPNAGWGVGYVCAPCAKELRGENE